MSDVNSTVRKARARAEAFKRDQVSTERAATAAEERARTAKQALKKAKKESKEARKAARKARRAAAAASRAFKKASARIKKAEAAAAKDHKIVETSAPRAKSVVKRRESTGRKTTAKSTVRPSSMKSAPPARKVRRPRRVARTAAPVPAIEASPEAETFVLPHSVGP